MLSDKQIEKGWKDTFSTDNPFCPCNLKSFTKAVHWAEHALSAVSEAAAAKPTELPQQPAPMMSAVIQFCDDGQYFTAEQMREYARAALAASLPPSPQPSELQAIRERLQNSVNWMMEGRNTGLCPGVADFQVLIRLIDAAPQPTDGVKETPPTPYRCIKPQCPADCSGCNHAIPGDDAARVLVADLLDAFAVDGHGATFEDGDSKLVDRARQFLGVRTAAPVAPMSQSASREDYEAHKGEDGK